MNGYEQALHDFQSAFRLRSRLLRIISLGICTLLSVGIVYHLGYGVDIPSKIYSLDNAGDIQNSTLGFSKIFAISLPRRSDKRDALSLAAAVTGFQFEFIDGVQGDSVAEAAKPVGWSEELTSDQLGCWRAHINIAQRMVREGITTALILEDDADWDVFLKQQLKTYARAARHLQKNGLTANDPRNSHVQLDSPYGSDWDLLWIGTCGAINKFTDDQSNWVVQEDPTAVPRKLWSYDRRQPNTLPAVLSASNYTRFVFEPAHGLCLFGYGLSLRGAKRLLYHQSLSGQALAVDRGIVKMCRENYSGFRCFVTYPAIFGQHRARGSMIKDSDIMGVVDNFREVGETAQIVFSTRLNLKGLIAGERQVESQYPEDTMYASASLDETLPDGHGVFIRKEEFMLES